MVIGLVALVMELRHSSRVAQVGAYQTRIAEIQEVMLELAVSETLASQLVKHDEQGLDALSAEERMRVRAWYHVILRQMQGQHYQYQQGFLDRAVIDAALSGAAGSR